MAHRKLAPEVDKALRNGTGWARGSHLDERAWQEWLRVKAVLHAADRIVPVMSGYLAVAGIDPLKEPFLQKLNRALRRLERAGNGRKKP